MISSSASQRLTPSYTKSPVTVYSSSGTRRTGYKRRGKRRKQKLLSVHGFTTIPITDGGGPTYTKTVNITKSDDIKDTSTREELAKVYSPLNEPTNPLIIGHPKYISMEGNINLRGTGSANVVIAIQISYNYKLLPIESSPTIIRLEQYFKNRSKYEKREELLTKRKAIIDQHGSDTTSAKLLLLEIDKQMTELKEAETTDDYETPAFLDYVKTKMAAMELPNLVPRPIVFKEVYLFKANPEKSVIPFKISQKISKPIIRSNTRVYLTSWTARMIIMSNQQAYITTQYSIGCNTALKEAVKSMYWAGKIIYRKFKNTFKRMEKVTEGALTFDKIEELAEMEEELRKGYKELSKPKTWIKRYFSSYSGYRSTGTYYAKAKRRRANRQVKSSVRQGELPLYKKVSIYNRKVMDKLVNTMIRLPTSGSTPRKFIKRPIFFNPRGNPISPDKLVRVEEDSTLFPTLLKTTTTAQSVMSFLYTSSAELIVESIQLDLSCSSGISDTSDDSGAAMIITVYVISNPSDDAMEITSDATPVFTMIARESWPLVNVKDIAVSAFPDDSLVEKRRYHIQTSGLVLKDTDSIVVVAETVSGDPLNCNWVVSGQMLTTPYVNWFDDTSADARLIDYYNTGKSTELEPVSSFSIGTGDKGKQEAEEEEDEEEEDEDIVEGPFDVGATPELL